MSDERDPPDALKKKFVERCVTPSDINEHLELLRELSSQCGHVTEIGMRGAVSTCALLTGQPDRLISWDINPYAIVSQEVADLLAMRGRTDFQPRVGDSLEVEIEPTDLLFIDSFHVAKQLKGELLRHGHKARKYLAFHDTITFGTIGEDGSEPGLRAAIRWFQKEHLFPLWELIEDRKNNNGFVVLKKVDS